MPDTPRWRTTAPLPLGATASAATEESQGHDALLPGTRLDEFEIVRVLGAGGFGIVYLALDHVLLRQVAIKEYMPTALAGRGQGAMVSVRSAALAATYALGLASFCDEARLLARFDHPALVKVHRFWKANGSAYMVMPYYPGQTLKEVRRSMRGSPDEAWLRAFVEPLLGALELLHREGVYHRDIAPDNILLLPDGRPVLLDFGSARRVIGDRTQTLTAVLKPNFAPVEQYADEASMRQGPWTDLYALGATVHFMLTGQAPTPAVLRAVRDALPALSSPGGAPYPGVAVAFLATIDWTLALAPDERPQSVASMRQAFAGEVVPPSPSPRHAAAPHPPFGAAATTVEPGGCDLIVADLIGDPTAPAPARVDLGAADGSAAPRPAATPTARQPRRAATLAAMAAFALSGLVAAGWGARAWTPAAAVLPDGLASAAPATAGTPPTPLPAARPLPPSLPPIEAAADVPAPRPAAPKTSVLRHPRQVVAAIGGNAAHLTAAAAKATAAMRPRPAVDGSAAGDRATVLPSATAPPDRCGGLSFFARTMCVSRLCQTPQWRAYPRCVEARRIEQQRQRRMDQ